MKHTNIKNWLSRTSTSALGLTLGLALFAAPSASFASDGDLSVNFRTNLVTKDPILLSEWIQLVDNTLKLNTEANLGKIALGTHDVASANNKSYLSSPSIYSDILQVGADILNTNGGVMDPVLSVSAKGQTKSAIRIQGSDVKPSAAPLVVFKGDDVSLPAFKVAGDGNVGIGVINPQAKLDVSVKEDVKFPDPRAVMARFENTSASGGAVVQIVSNDTTKEGGTNPMIEFERKGLATVGRMAYTPTGDFFMQPNNGGAGQATAVYIKNNGNVGIGTNAPQAKLNVSAKEDVKFPDPRAVMARFENTSASGGAVVQIVSNDTTKEGGTNPMIEFERKGLTTVGRMAYTPTGDFFIQPNNGGAGQATAVYIKNNGNVGIGTNASGRKLGIVTNKGSATEEEKKAVLLKNIASSGSNQGAEFAAESNGSAGIVGYTMANPKYKANLGMLLNDGTVRLVVRNSAGTPTNYLNMYQNGSSKFSGTLTAANFPSSDERLKKNVKPFEQGEALEKILAMEGFTFDWKKDDRHDIGFIAQKVQKIFPELVITDGEGYLAVNYAALVSPLVEAVKELNAKITTLEQENAQQQAQIDELMKRIEALEAK
jgi:hypothetical protein